MKISHDKLRGVNRLRGCGDEKLTGKLVKNLYELSSNVIAKDAIVEFFLYLVHIRYISIAIKCGDKI